MVVGEKVFDIYKVNSALTQLKGYRRLLRTDIVFDVWVLFLRPFSVFTCPPDWLPVKDICWRYIYIYPKLSAVFQE